MPPLALSFISLCLFAGASPVSAGEALTANPAIAVSPQIQELQRAMMQDERTMELIRALQDDPQIQELLQDPAVMRAILGGDTATLMGNEELRAVMSNRTVRDIQRRMEHR
jgi:hypothetical protein